MQHLEVSGAVRPIYGSLGVKRLMYKFLFYNKFIICLYMFRALCAHHQEVKIILYSIWYHHTCRWPSRAQLERRDTKQTNQVQQYKNTKIKLYKCNAAIWYNKPCRIRQLIPACFNIRVNGNNPSCQCDDTRCCIIQF